MARLACVNVPALPLQWLLRGHPEWRAGPAAVARDERAQSPLLWVNRHARALGIRPGMRHAAALSLSHELKAGVTPAAEIAAELAALTRDLQHHSPHVEAARDEPGVFWLNAEGLARVAPDLREWAQGLRASVRARGFAAGVVVGHGRFTSYALAKLQPRVAVHTAPAAERRATLAVPLERLDVAPRTLGELRQLGVLTVRDLLALPPLGLLPRFGPELYRLHRRAAQALDEGLTPAPEELPAEAALLLDYPEADVTRLLFRLKGCLHELVATLRERQEALKALHLRLSLEGQAPRRTVLRPAAATRDVALLTDLLRLRLEGLVLELGVTGVELLAEGEPRSIVQLSLFPTHGRRDPDAAARALARVRAEFGDGAVLRAVLREAHLPEAAFAWEPLQQLPGRKPGGPEAASSSALPRLVRRLHEAPAVLLQEAPGARAPPGVTLARLARAAGWGEAPRLHGPYTLSGGWWGALQHRDYHFVETAAGELYWVYHDRQRGQWVLQGRVD